VLQRHLPAACLLAATLLGVASLPAVAATDLQYPPTSSAGHDFNHAPVGQSFRAEAASVRAGLHLADQQSLTDWLASQNPGSTPAPYPHAIAPSIRVRAELLAGEGTGGTVLHSRELSLDAPHFGYVEIDYAAAGIRLTPGLMYTLLLTDISGQAYPNGVTGWLVSSVFAAPTGGSTGNGLPPGAYADGLPILQGQVQFADAGIGDNAFTVIDAGSVPPPPPGTGGCSGSYAVVTTVAKTFIEVNGGQTSADRVYYAPQAATTFTGGTTGFAALQRVSYLGTLDIAGCHATQMTVYPVPTPVVVGGTLPAGKVGVAYSATLTASGGIAPYAWTAAGLPAGLDFADGTLSGTPTLAGRHALIIDTQDAIGQTARNEYLLDIAAAAPTCPTPAAGRETRGQGTITAVGDGSIRVGLRTLVLDACTDIRVEGGGRTLTVGQRVRWEGTVRNGVLLARRIEVR